MEESYSVAVPAEKKFSIWKISYFIIGIFAFILPFFILPVDMPFQMGKGLLFVIAVILALVFYIVSVIKEAKLEVPANLLFLSALVIPLVFLLSAIVNGFNQLGVLGYSFELGTVSSIVIAFIFLFLVSALFQKKENIFRSDPFDTRLEAHKLHGRLRGYWAFWLDQKYRIIFEFADENVVWFHSVGDHSIYR